ncbi:MAG: hypothetical protein OXR67_02150 [Chloroflexota bacterium]|nr:hypothetical protein [Chloroflexota bacterium]
MTLEAIAAIPATPPAARELLEWARFQRNRAWESCPLIPSWVNLEDVDLDRIFTRPEIAEQCTDSLLSLMESDFADTGRYDFIDPGAGPGVFYDLLPEGRRIGVDIVPVRPEFVSADYLTWTPPAGRRYAVVGNPPFGYRAWLTLAFINHSATFADYIGFIVPMGFQSDGKGSPKLRVVGAELVQSEPLPAAAFIDEYGQSVKLNALWQVWRRGVNNQPPIASCDEWIDLFTVDHRKERLCGQTRLREADWFLQRTYYGEPPTLVRDFDDVRYGCGYGIVLRKDHDLITSVLQETDWDSYSNLALHNCRHISMYHIRQAVIDRGFVDG